MFITTVRSPVVPSIIRHSLRAATEVPTIFFDSEPDSGYSVDDLPPSTPTGISMTETLILQWEDNGEPDLGGYLVYGKYEEYGESGI